MSGKHPDGKDAPQAQRLRRLREAMGYKIAKTFAEKFVGISERRWSNFENGHPLSGMVARILKAKIPGLSIDWLDEGDPSRLSVEMARKLGELPAPESKGSGRRAAARK